MCVLSLLVASIGLVAQSKFAIQQDSYGDGSDTVHLLVLTNLDTKENVKIAHDVGGTIEELHLLNRQGRLRSVLSGHGRDAKATRAMELYAGAMLAPFANRIKGGTYNFDNHQYNVPINEPDRNNALHGFLATRPMTVGAQFADDTQANVTLSYTFGSDPGYPFTLDLSITYRLDKGGLTLKVSATNRQAQRALPFTFGWHPYFIVSDVSRATVRLDPCTQWGHVIMSAGAPREGDLIPTGDVQLFKGLDGRTPIGGTKEKPTYLDDEFVALAPSALCDGLKMEITDVVGNNDTMVLWQDRNFGVSQIFTGSMELANKSAIALEPMAGLADAFNNHAELVVLSAGQQWLGYFGVSLK